ncbi:MAG: NAD(P)/FAD-dependent oxidoreductase [Rudaea sp.]|uniref:FAD-dependent oxidoreductase n=1 Tax=unclassified Rudaea TaxID=2627037 RepID=UPI0010F9FE9A|nr:MULTISPECIES: FAD-dependent oxidoreductase [unclassified Rudaea]MBN8887819.1 NAD(P)/FAD-dependent oxidoreductase [Rudaea sp.]
MAERYDVLVVGAGPAGLAATQAAAGYGARVGLVDAQSTQGGQVWRRDVRGAVPPDAAAAFRAVANLPNLDWLAQTQIVAATQNELLVEHDARARSLRYDKLVLACGARELLLPFPGWTLPGVFGAGGAQALVKQGWPIAGKRVVVAGSGPLLLAAAATLKKHGANVLGIYEQAAPAQLAAFASRLWRWPAKAAQAVALRAALAGVTYRAGAVVAAAHGDAQLRAIELRIGKQMRQIDCDHLAVGYGLVPNVELAELLGCALDASGRHPRVAVDADQRTSLANVYAAGEICGIGGRDAARIEGAIAGHAAAGAMQAAQAMQSARRRARRFSALLEMHFALDPRVRELATDDTVVCRCENVAWSALRDFDDARAAKLQTRCGMGACQGRICGTALAELGRYARGGLRPPIFPARLATLADSDFASIENQTAQ